MAPVGATLLLVRGSALYKEIRAGLVVAPVCFNQDVKALVPTPAVVPKFLTYSLLGRSQELFSLVSTAGNSAGVLDTKLVQALEIFLPAPTEQRAIAETLSDVDGLLAAQDALIAKKRDIKLAAMQQLLTGRTRLPGFSGRWETKRMVDVAEVDPENLPSSTSPDLRFNYISLEQVDAGRLLGYTEEVFRTAPSRARRVLRRDDVLMSTVRPNLMGHLLYRDQVANAVCSTGFAVLRAKRGASAPDYIYAHLFAHIVKDQVDGTLSGSNYPAISSRDVKCIEIPVPPIDEQTAISDTLSDMDAEIAALEAQRDKTLMLKQGMMQQLLTGRVRLVRPEATA